MIRGSTADLYALTGPGKGLSCEEAKYASIELTDELRTMNGFIVECCYCY